MDTSLELIYIFDASLFQHGGCLFAPNTTSTVHQDSFVFERWCVLLTKFRVKGTKSYHFWIHRGLLSIRIDEMSYCVFKGISYINQDYIFGRS